MHVLLIGSGGREHALAWALSRSKLLTKLYAAPGNPGIGEFAACIALDVADHEAVIAFCKKHAIDLVVIGPEMPLVAGLVDDLAAAGIRAFGPTKAAARLEGSKGFTKDLCREADIPTAAYARFDALEPALAHARRQPLPVVVKADGLAAGKGVVIAERHGEAGAALRSIFGGAFGAAGAAVVIEEFLEGQEASLFALCDGTECRLLATAQDYKRAFDGDRGPNTGGMGAISPAPAMTPELRRRAMREIVRPTLAVLRRRGAPYRGVLYAGLMITADGPKLIEYNVRFGDPEAQALLLRLETDLLALLVDGLRGVPIGTSDDAAITVVMAARGYPGAYESGSEIRGLETAAAIPGVRIFHAGTRYDAGRLVAAGGRVLNVAANGKTIGEARERAYAAVDRIDWREGTCRRDIGADSRQER